MNSPVSPLVRVVEGAKEEEFWNEALIPFTQNPI